MSNSTLDAVSFDLAEKIRKQRNNMRKMLATLAILLSTSTTAQTEKPAWISVESLLHRYENTGDFSYLSNALYRCSAMNSIYGAIFVRDGVASGSELMDTSFEQMLIGNAFAALKRQKRGAEIDLQKAIADQSILQSEMYKLMESNYISWLTHSYTVYGDYTSEPDMKIEIAACKETTSLAESVLNSALQ